MSWLTDKTGGAKCRNLWGLPHQPKSLQWKMLLVFMMPGSQCWVNLIVEGNFILISGNSEIEGATKLESVGLKVQDIVVLLDHEQDVKNKLRANGYQAHSVLTLSEVTQTLYQADRISESEIKAFAEAQE